MVTPSESLAYRPQPEPGAEAANGLCLNCRNNVNCVLMTSKTPILECEEYAFEPGSNLRVHHTESVQEVATGNFMGLCMNCDLRDSCTLPRSESGVWHCEEYC